jgi:hypothetical protein
MMADIYHCANKVLVYLGEKDDRGTSDWEMNLIEDVDRLVPNTSQPWMGKILERPWFRRIWVVQEIARSKVAVVICGEKSVRWDCFAIWPRRVSHLKRSLELIPGVLSFNSGFQPVRGTLLNHLHETRNSLATDPRDKIIGLLGLIPSERSWSLLVNYSVSTGDLYLKVACLFVSEEKSLRFLSAVQPSTAICIRDQLPSWVPDWSVQTQVVTLGLGRNYTEPYDAGGSPAFAAVIDERYLLATGIQLDQVKSIGMAYTERRGFYRPISEDWAKFFELNDGKKKRDSIDYEEQHKASKLAQSCFEATTTAAPPCSLQKEAVVSCRSWKCERGGKVIAGLTTDKLDPLCEGRRMFETESGLLGLGPEGLKDGDCIMVLLGGPVPYVLRREESRYRFIGECYVFGAMSGEALSHLRYELEAMGHQLGPCGASICNAKLEKFVIL